MNNPRVIAADPLIYVGDGNAIKHMLRVGDRKTVPIVLDYFKQFSMPPAMYLGSNVLSDWLGTGERNYGDIDFLGATINEGIRKDITSTLIGLTLQKFVQLHGRNFRVIQEQASKYMQVEIDQRFKFHPGKLVSGSFSPSLGSAVIDISLISHTKFNSTQ